MALASAEGAFVVIPPLVIVFSIAVKWLVIGRVKPGDYPLWGAYYFRWWLVRRVLDVIPTPPERGGCWRWPRPRAPLS